MKWIEVFFAPPDAFKKGPQKLSFLNLKVRPFIKTLLQRSLKISVMVFADFLKATKMPSIASLYHRLLKANT